MLDPHELLRVGLRSRAATVPELAEIALCDVPTARRALEALATDGHLLLRGDRIVYDAPDRVAGRIVRQRAEQLATAVRGQLEGLASVVDGLPQLLAEWQVAAGESGPVRVDLFHGWSAVTDLWHQLLESEPLRRTDVILPDASRLHVADPAMQAAWHDVVRTEGNRARVLGNIADAADPGIADRVAEELAAGVEMRMMADPPSWCWVADGSIVALPLAWGEGWPTTVMAVHSPAVASMVQWLFDRLWDAAVPIVEEAHGWDALLRLMAGGATLEAASTIGTGSPTARVADGSRTRWTSTG